MQLLRADDFGGQRHGRLKPPVRRIMGGEVGRAAVEHDAGAYPVAAHIAFIAVQQGGGAVADAALAGQVDGGGVKDLQLMVHAMVHIGVAEVGHEGDFIDLSQCVQAGICRTKTLGCKAQPVHAAVHLEEHAVADLGLVCGQPVNLLVAVHGMPQAQS